MNESTYQRWICDACGFIYDEEKGDPDSGLAAGTRYHDIPDGWECPLCGMTKSDLRLLPEAPPIAAVSRQSRPSSKSRSRGGSDFIVIIGAGIAGWSVAESMRLRDPQRSILLISACKGLVYPKPAISLAISQGRSADDLIDTDAVTRAAELGIEVLTETRVLKIDSSRKRVTTTKGGIEYDKLILALGAHQRELPVDGDAAESMLRVNDLLSFKKLQQRLSDGVKSVTILGAGLIGSEFADDLTRAGYQVRVIDPNDQPLSGLLPSIMSTELQQRLAAKGVGWHFGVTLKSLNKTGHSMTAQLSDGSAFSTDLVLSAAGLVTNTALAEKCGLCIDVGIAVNSDMQTSNANIYALGDCASIDGKLFSYIEPIRRQADAIAANLTGDDQHFIPSSPMVKIKTQSMPMSVCRPGSEIKDESWLMVRNDKEGCHFEIFSETNIIGFALSDSLSSEAGNYYRKLSL